MYFENAWYLVNTILHQSIVIHDNSIGVLFTGLLDELPPILDSFSPVPQVIIYGVIGQGTVVGKIHAV